MDIAWIASDMDCIRLQAAYSIELHWIEWLSFGLQWMWVAFGSKLYVLVALHWIVVSTTTPKWSPQTVSKVVPHDVGLRDGPGTEPDPPKMCSRKKGTPKTTPG